MSRPNTATEDASAAAAVVAAEDNGESRTTILPPGVVESRNYSASDGKKSLISAEMRAFIAGTDGNGGSLGLRSEYRTFFTVWTFVTRLPGPAWIDLHPGFLMRGMGYFPIVGTVLGGTIAIALDCMIASIGLPVAAAATLAVGCGLHVTGCFHEDGLADSADGLGGGWSRSQVQKIMTDSRLGTFGVAALTLFLLAKVQLLDSLGASRWEPRFGAGGVVSSGAGPALLVSQTLSRLAAPYLIRTRDYVAEVGPNSPFYLFMVEAKHLVSWPRVALAAGHCLVVASALYGLGVAVTLVAAVLALAHLAGRKGEYLLGGVMGDFLGGTICVCEILVLALIVSRDAIVETCRVASDTILSAEGFFDPLRLAVTLYGSDRLRPLVHFVLLLAVLKIWCTFVGPPDMYDREDDKIEKDEAEKKD